MSDILGKIFGKDKDHKGHHGHHGKDHKSGHDKAASAAAASKWQEFCEYYASMWYLE